MKELSGKTIMIGREPGRGQLLVAIRENGKCGTIGERGSVSRSVSRCIPSEGKAHACISVDDNGDMVISTTKNVTYVNGMEIAKKQISQADVVELGADKFRISIPDVIRVATQLIASASAPAPAQKANSANSPKKYNISHLERVWNEREEQMKEIQKKQKKINLVRSGCGVFTMCAMPCIGLIGPIGYALTGIGILGNIYSFVGLKNDNTTDAVEKITDSFEENYVCPNPDCNKFLGNIKYKLLKKNYSHCPYCKCEFVSR